MIVRLTRFVAFTAGALGGLAVSRLIDWSESIGVSESLVIILFVILGCSIGYLLGSILGREIEHAYDRLDERLRSVAATDLVLVTGGVTTGLVIAILLGNPLRLIEPKWLSFASASLLTLMLAYGFARIALVKRTELAMWAGRRLDPEELDDEPLSSLKIVDTSAVIDGRLQDLMRTGILEGRVVVPRFVVAELQTLADSADDLKRSRGRRGLDILEAMRSGPTAVELFTVDYAELTDVDSKLLRLAEDSKGTIVTLDYNLTKVARVQGICAVNINELSNALRPNIMSGESMSVVIVRVGKEPGQGVAYLEDGTMVVVEGAAESVGDEIEVTVTSLFQAAAGRMVFAKVGRAQ